MRLHQPVRILSISTSTDDIKQSYGKGWNVYLTKPDDGGTYARLAASIEEFRGDEAQSPDGSAIRSP